MADQTPITHTATVSATDFMRAVLNAKLAASTDDTLPSLTAVRFRPGHSKGTLMLEATNRYIASQEEIDLVILDEFDSDWYPADIERHMINDHGYTKPESQYGIPADIEKRHAAMPHGTDGIHTHTVRPMPETELDVKVNAKVLDKLVRTLKLVIDPDTKHLGGLLAPHVVISHEVGSHKVDFTLVQNNGTDTKVSPPLVEGDSPRIDSLMSASVSNSDKLADVLREWATADEAKALDSVLATSVCFNADYLAVFTKVDPGERMVPVKLHMTTVGETGAPKPVRITVGQRYTGLIVPIRHAG